MEPVAILGTGMAAYGAAQRLTKENVPFCCFDRGDLAGGHTSSFIHPGGYVFDDGPHVSFTKDARIQELLASNVRGEYEEVRANINNYWHGHWITHPVQCHLQGLPTDLVVDVIRDFVDIHREPERPIGSYAEWLVAAYGRTFAENFPMEYGLKYHTTSAANMTTEWLGPRMYRPSLEEVLRGALSPATADVHYVTSFRYPTRGGFAAYLQPFFAQPEISLRHEVTEIDPRERSLTFSDGTTTRYGRIISSIPLPELIRLVRRAPADVRAAADRLAFSTVVLINLVVERDDISEAHISYFYDRDIVFPRATFPHLLSPNNTPAGTGSIQAEIYFSPKYRPLEQSGESLIGPVLDGLTRTGILRESDRILFREARVTTYANIIYDLERAPALEVVHGFLDDVGILPCGRYGDWNHEWTDEAFLSGEAAAERALSGGL